MATVDGKGNGRINVRLSPDQRMQVEYWRNKREMSFNEYVEWAINFAIDYENGNYPLATLEQARLNQLVDTMKGMSVSMDNMTDMLRSTLRQWIELANDTNPLLDDEDGELDGAKAARHEELDQ